MNNYPIAEQTKEFPKNPASLATWFGTAAAKVIVVLTIEELEDLANELSFELTYDKPEAAQLRRAHYAVRRLIAAKRQRRWAQARRVLYSIVLPPRAQRSGMPAHPLSLTS